MSKFVIYRLRRYYSKRVLIILLLLINLVFKYFVFVSSKSFGLKYGFRFNLDLVDCAAVVELPDDNAEVRNLKNVEINL